jgi:hypothetical protein
MPDKGLESPGFSRYDLGMPRSLRVETAKFAVADHVRFIGTDTTYTVRQYDKDILQYQVQCGDDRASLVWVSEIYLEQAGEKPGRRLIDPLPHHGTICR